MPIQTFEERVLTRLNTLQTRLDDFIALDKPGSLRLTTGYVPFAGSNGALTSDSNLFWDNTNKRLGIGNTAPDLELDIQSASTAFTAIEITNTDNSTRRWAFGAASNAGTFAPAKGFMVRDVSGGVTVINISTSSYVAIGQGATAASYRLELPNTASAAGQGRANAWVTYSSRTRKQNIVPVNAQLRAKARQLRVVTFDWENGGSDIGLIAEDVYAILPDLVSGDITQPETLAIKESKAGLLALALIIDLLERVPPQ